MRDSSSSKAKGLTSRGVKTVEGELRDKGSLVAALQDADAAYLVTDFRGPDDIQGELDQGRTFLEAAKEAGVTL